MPDEATTHGTPHELGGQVDPLVMPQLLHGDALEVMSGSVQDGIADLILTDPPFSSGTRREASKGLRKSMTRGKSKTEWFGSDSLTTEGFLFLMRSCALQWHRILKPGGHVLCFIDWRMMAHLADAIESADLRKAGVVVWDKTYFGMGSCFRNQHEMILHFTKDKGLAPQRRDVGNVIQAKPIRGGVHPTEKPVELLERLISVTCPEGGVIVDPFAGVCTTGEAAMRTGRASICIEREQGYLDIARSRLAA